MRLTVTDDRGGTATEQHTVTVTQPPHAPEAADDVLDAAPTGVLDVLANDVDEDGDAISVVSNSAAAHGTVACGPLGSCTYTAANGYVGGDSFTYTVRDASGREDTATVTITVAEPPGIGAPVARADEVSTRRGHGGDVRRAGQRRRHGPRGHGRPPIPSTARPPARRGGSCTYTPQADFSGVDGFRYTIADDDGDESSAEVHITVAPADAAFGVAVGGGAGPISSGEAADWGVGVAGVPAGSGDDALAALPRPTVTATLGGAHAIEPGSLRTARGWTAGAPVRRCRERDGRRGRAARGGRHPADRQAAPAGQPGRGR